MIGRREHNRRQQRTRILDAAFALFSEQGFDDVTVGAVARAAGVARATVFNHFGSKQGLVDALTGQVLDYYRAMLDNALADESTPTPVLLRALFEQMGAGIENTRRVQRGVFREIARLSLGFDEGGPAQRSAEENNARLVELLARGQKRGDLHRTWDPEALAAALTVLANGTITGWLFDEREPPLRERMRTAAEIFLGSVAVDADGSRSATPPDLNPEVPWRF